MPRVTVFTPTYNRANVISRVYNSLLKQTYTDFCWLIVDDGSVDNTKEVVEAYMAEGKVDISYFYQQNSGKHCAINKAVNLAKSELFIIADSDDSFTENAIERLVNTWDSIPEQEKSEYKGVICRCFDTETGLPIGRFPKEQFDSDDLEAFFKEKLNFEKWMLFRTDVLREFPFPEEKGLKFYPETIVWQRMARKYKTRYIDDALRGYFKDQENALTHAKTPRFKENVYLWEHRINHTMDYFWFAPFYFLKGFIGLSRDYCVLGKPFRQVIRIPNNTWKRALCICLYPVGKLLSLKYTKDGAGV